MGLPEHVFSLRRRNSKEPSERTQLLESLAHTRLLITQAYSGFDNARDQELIESFVYEINALQARYSYLLRRITELEHAPGQT